MTARRKRQVFAVAALCVVLAGLAGCQYWYRDMKGYLEYWSSTVTVGNLTWRSTPEHQKNSSGMYTIPTNAVVSVTASIENPDNYPLDSGVGSARDSLRSVRTAGTIGGTVRVTEATATSITAELIPHSFVPTSESRLLEHRDFTVTIAPTRTDNGMQAANPQELTLRYNTPPRMPLEVVEEGGKLGFLSSTSWKMVQGSSTQLDGRIYWAWPKGITDPKDSDYAAQFQVYQDGVLQADGAASQFLLDTVDSSLLSLATAVTDAGYNVYAASVDSGKVITIKALDGEGVASQGTVSGRSPHKITLNGSGGTFEDAKTQVEMYKAGGSLVSGGDLETPVRPGHYLSGWAVTQGGEPVAFPYEVTKEAALYALWEEDRVLQNGINRKTGEYEKPAQDTSGSYQVANAGNLLWIAGRVASGAEQGAKITLTADITIPDNEWQPIGTAEKAYTGTFDGGNHTINLGSQAVGGAGDAYGLFGNVSGATVQDLTLEGNVTMNRTSAGAENHYGVIAIASGTTTVTNVHSEVNLTIQDSFDRGATGGIVGASLGGNNTLTIERCSFSGTIDAGTAYTDVLGGILAYREAFSNNNASLNDCLFNGKIKAHLGQIGGLVGYSRGAALTVKDCLVVGTITSSSYDTVGYVVGLLLQHGTANQDITNNYYRDHGVPGLNSFGDNLTDYGHFKPTDDIGEFNGQTREGSATKATEEELKDDTILGKLNASGSNWEYINGKYPTLKNP